MNSIAASDQGVADSPSETTSDVKPPSLSAVSVSGRIARRAMMIDAKERCLIEYAEVGNLKRHYSTLRYGLSSFLVTVSLASFANYVAQTNPVIFLAIIGQLMLCAGLLSCLVLSYRCEKANLYTRCVWRWLEGQSEEEPTHFFDFNAKKAGIVRGMCLDEMNWIMLIVAVLITIVFWASV